MNLVPHVQETCLSPSADAPALTRAALTRAARTHCARAQAPGDGVHTVDVSGSRTASRSPPTATDLATRALRLII